MQVAPTLPLAISADRRGSARRAALGRAPDCHSRLSDARPSAARRAEPRRETADAGCLALLLPRRNAAAILLGATYIDLEVTSGVGQTVQKHAGTDDNCAGSSSAASTSTCGSYPGPCSGLPNHARWASSGSLLRMAVSIRSAAPPVEANSSYRPSLDSCQPGARSLKAVHLFAGSEIPLFRSKVVTPRRVRLPARAFPCSSRSPEAGRRQSA